MVGVSAAVSTILGWYYGTLSTITVLALFIMLNVAFSLQTIGVTYSNAHALSGVFVLYIYGGAIVMLFLLAAVSIPRNQLTSTKRPEVSSIATNQVLALLSWPCCLLLMVPALQVGTLADRRFGFMDSKVSTLISSPATQIPLANTNTTELVRVAEGMVQEPMLYVQACALLMLGLVVVIELTTNTKEVQYFSKHANQTGATGVTCAN